MLLIGLFIGFWVGTVAGIFACFKIFKGRRIK